MEPQPFTNEERQTTPKKKKSKERGSEFLPLALRTHLMTTGELTPTTYPQVHNAHAGQRRVELQSPAPLVSFLLSTTSICCILHTNFQDQMQLDKAILQHHLARPKRARTHFPLLFTRYLRHTRHSFSCEFLAESDISLRDCMYARS